MSEAHPSETRLGEIVEIDDRTVLVLGQGLDLHADQPDVANALVHRVGDTVFLIDTGVTTPFRDALRSALDRVGAWDRLVLLTTHGHPDHVGNNDLIDELAKTRDIRVEHYLPAPDLGQMRDPQEYWTECFQPLAGLAPLPAAPALVAIKITSLFTPYQAFGTASHTFEELPVEAIRLGSQDLTGWTFADGAVSVWRTQGHCAGHVLIHLRDNGLLHLGDEANGPCAVMPDADQVKVTATHRSARRLIADGVVATVTDGHTFGVQDADAAAERFDRLVDQSEVLQRAASAATSAADTVAAGDFVERFTAALRELGNVGANPNPVFTGMTAARQLEALGYRPGLADASRWHRVALETPHHGLDTAARGIGGAVATVGWLARGRQHWRRSELSVPDARLDPTEREMTVSVIVDDHRSYPPGVPCWVDLEQPDPERAAAFYATLFGWEFHEAMPAGAPGTYLIATLDGHDVAAIGAAGAGGPSWNTYVATADVDAAVEAVTAAGGTVRQPAVEAGPAGCWAEVADPSGAVFRLWQAGRRLGAQLVNVPGAWNFSDLLTPDPATAMDFYAAVLGWRVDPGRGAGMIMLPGYGDHLEATVDPQIRERQAFAPPGFADVVAGCAEDPGPPRWHLRFTVADRDAAVASALAGGAEVLRSADTEWTREALIRDPQGAELTLSQFAPAG